MKLHEFKTKYLSKLALYQPKSERERQLKDTLINKLYPLRSMTLPYLIHTLYEIIEHEKDVSDKFKQLCRDMIEDVQKLEGTE